MGVPGWPLAMLLLMDSLVKERRSFAIRSLYPRAARIAKDYRGAGEAGTAQSGEIVPSAT